MLTKKHIYIYHFNGISRECSRPKYLTHTVALFTQCRYFPSYTRPATDTVTDGRHVVCLTVPKSYYHKASLDISGFWKSKVSEAPLAYKWNKGFTKIIEIVQRQNISLADMMLSVVWLAAVTWSRLRDIQTIPYQTLVSFSTWLVV